MGRSVHGAASTILQRHRTANSMLPLVEAADACDRFSRRGVEAKRQGHGFSAAADALRHMVVGTHNHVPIRGSPDIARRVRLHDRAA